MGAMTCSHRIRIVLESTTSLAFADPVGVPVADGACGFFNDTVCALVFGELTDDWVAAALLRFGIVVTDAGKVLLAFDAVVGPDFFSSGGGAVSGPSIFGFGGVTPWGGPSIFGALGFGVGREDGPHAIIALRASRRTRADGSSQQSADVFFSAISANFL